MHRQRIYADVQHGLGNRLRALASAAVIAEKTNRELVVVWQPDHHCECRIDDLFHYEAEVIEQAFVDDAVRQGMTVFNYMEIEPGAQKDAPIVIAPQKDIYVRSAYVLNSPLTDWNAECQFLRSLNPVVEVQELVQSVRSPNDVSAHVRMSGGKDYEHLTYEAPDNWSAKSHAEIEFWRRKSHFSRFMISN